MVLLWIGLRLAALNRPFWMDESFSAALAFQSPAMIVDVCEKDVHPPGYYLLLRAWNAVLRPGQPAVEWTLIDFKLPAIETMGLFEWDGPQGRIKTPGVFPKEPIYWHEAPLAPLHALRLLSIFFGGLAALFSYWLARRLFPDSKSIALIVLFFFAASGYTLTWDTIIRSYSCGAALSTALVLAGIWGLQSNRLKSAAALAAILIAASFLTNYPTIIIFPGALLLIWLASGANRRSFTFAAASLVAGGVLVLILWGRSFFGQFGKIPSEAILAQPFGQALGDQFGRVVLDYWRMLFSEGVWRYLANPQSDYLDSLLNLSPTNPILYLIAFSLYAGAILASFYRLYTTRSRLLLGIAAAAFLPGLFIIVGNVIKPGFFRLHARHLYPAAPFFYLFIAHGLSVLFRCKTRDAKT